jgi:predicted alpha/beta hydrolase family esterase
MLFFINHGQGGDPFSDFIPFLKNGLEERGLRTHTPEYPCSWTPEYAAWETKFNNDMKSVWNQEDDIVLIGHSIGGYFTLRILSENPGAPWVQKVVGVILVASVAVKSRDSAKFYSKEIEWANIRALGARIVAIWSTDDKNVSMKHQTRIREELRDMPGFEYRELTGWHHFLEATAPPILEAALGFIP